MTSRPQRSYHTRAERLPPVRALPLVGTDGARRGALADISRTGFKSAWSRSLPTQGIHR